MLIDCLWEHADKPGTVAMVDEFESIVSAKRGLHDPSYRHTKASARRLLTEDDELPTRMPSGLADDGGCRLYTSSMCGERDALDSYPAGADPAHTLVLVQRDVTTYGTGAHERVIQQAFTAESTSDFHKWGESGDTDTPDLSPLSPSDK